MRHHPALFERALTASNAFEEAQPVLKRIPGLDIDQVRARDPMLGDGDGSPRALEISEEAGRLPLQRGDELGAHEVILKWHFAQRNTTSSPASSRADLTDELEPSGSPRWPRW